MKTDPKIIAVITTFQRAESLKTSLEILSKQSLKISEIIVIDNDDSNEIQKIVSVFKNTFYVGSATNLGGAGGFALGMLLALAKGAEYVWLADDDGRPEDETVLEKLFNKMNELNLQEISPLVVDINNHEKLAFPLRKGVIWHRNRSDLLIEDNEQFLLGIASLFNGALFTKKALEVVGVPDYRLFIRGDEVEIHRRLVRSGLKFGTLLTTAYLHPQGSDEFKPILGGKIHAQHPDNVTKRFYTYRNRGFILSQTGMRKLLLQEWIRFGWFFIVNKKSVKEFNNWRKLQKLGREEKLYRYEDSKEINEN